MKQTWLEKYGKPCKIGTVPMCVRIHGKDRIEPGKYVRIMESEGATWERVLVRSVSPDGHFFADRM